MFLFRDMFTCLIYVSFLLFTIIIIYGQNSCHCIKSMSQIICILVPFNENIQCMFTSGYSTTPLAKKLGIKEHFQYLLYNQPEHYFTLFSDLPDNITSIETIIENSADFIHLFLTTEDELISMVRKYKPALKKTGVLWISWPKGSSKKLTDLKRDFIREHLLSIGLVDVKIAAIDADWSGLKFVYRLKDRN